MNIVVLAFSIMAGTPKGRQAQIISVSESNYWDPDIWNPQEKSGMDEKENEAKAREGTFRFDL